MASSFGVSSLGTSALLARLNNLMQEVPKELDKALYREALAIFRKSQRIVPVGPINDPTYRGIPGTLRASGVVEGPTNHEVLIGYGGLAAHYAIYVHEDPNARHKPGKSYKFLEIPFMEALPGMDKRLADALDNRSKEPTTDAGSSDMTDQTGPINE